MAIADSSTFLEKTDGYKIHLPNFEGPLDLLLYLIKREEIEIYDIPIAEITRQYLEYIDLMRELDLEVAGEFILMAATLIQIKVRMLLPRHEEEDEEAEQDPRADLVHRLLEYKRFKEVAESLAEIETRQRRIFPRKWFSYERSLAREKPGEEEPLVQDISLFDLLTAFKQVLDHMPRITSHLVNMPSVTVEEQIEWIENILKEKKRLAFSVLMADLKDRIVIVITFMAILEMMRTRRIRIQQAALFGEIWISGPADQES